MHITHRYHSFIFLVFLLLGIASGAKAQSESHFDGFSADLAFGYRMISASTTSALTINGNAVPSSVSSSQPTNTLSALAVGYNFNISPGYYLGIGASIVPGSGQAQQVQLQALNQTINLQGVKPLYNYGIFLSPALIIGEGLAYFKAGTQTQVNNSNTSSNYNGYLLGLGYKQFVYQSIYLFGEVDYVAYNNQTSGRTADASGRLANISINTAPSGERFLLGLGYQF